jgi:hypothetical protein
VAIRWLWFDHIPPGVELTAAERREVARRSRQLRSAHPSTRHKHGSLIAAVIGWSLLEALVLLGAIFFVMPMLGTSAARNSAIIALLLLICVPFWLMISLAFNRSHAPFVREALNELGHPVCMKCGYALRGLNELAARCPECGEERDAFRAGDKP